MADREQAVIARLEDQIAWYDKRSARNQQWYKWLRVLAMAATGLVPVSAGLGYSAAVGGVLGFIAFFFEGLQQLNQHHSNWISYRSTCEALKHEKHLFTARAAHYRSVEDPVTLLAEQVESLVSVEHAKWVNNTRDTDEHKPPPHGG